MAIGQCPKGGKEVQQDFEDLVTDLHSTLISKRLKAVKGLGKLKADLVTEQLRKMLNDRSKEVRCATVEALGNCSPSNLPEILFPLSTDRSADVRLRVAHSLGNLETPESIKILIELLHDTKDDVADMAARSLAKFPGTGISHLIKSFGDRYWKVRRRACIALGRIGAKAAEYLRSALREPDSNVRFWAAVSLGKLKERTYIEDLLQHLNDENIGVRIACLKALREIGDPSVVNKLFEALSESSDQVRDVIFDILKDFGSHSIPFLIDSLSNEFWMGRSLAGRALAEMGSESIAPLLRALEGQDKERRFWAIKIMGQLRETSALPEIKKALLDPESEIRLAAAQAIGDFRLGELVPVLIERFLDPSWEVRREAHQGIVKCGEEAVSHLIKSLESIDEDVRYWTLRTLGELRPQKAFKPIVKLLKDRSWSIRRTASQILAKFGDEALLELTNLATEGDSEIRYWVLQTLGTIGSTISLPLLFKALEDSSTAIRAAAQKAIGNYGIGIFEDLITLLKSENRRRLESVVAAIHNLPADQVIPKLCQSLGKYDDHVNYWLRRAIAGFPLDARKPVKLLLESKANEVRRQALLVLSKIGQFADAEDILLHLKDEYWPARAAAAEALGMLGNSIAIDDLMIALEDEDEDLALSAAKSLGSIGDPKSVPALLTALSRESWTMKYQVIEILGRMKVKRAVSELIRILDEDTLDLKIPIIKTLGEIGHPESFKQLKERFLKEKESGAKMAYIDSLAKIGNPAILPDFLEMIKPDKSWEERRIAIKALGILKSPDSKGPLIDLLRETDVLVKREALNSLKLLLKPEEYASLEEKLSAGRRRQEMFTRYFQGGLNQMKLGAMADAEKSFLAALKIHPKSAGVYSALGNMYYKTGKLIEATKAYHMASTFEPRDPVLKINLGMVFYRRRAYREALAVFEALLKICDPKSQQSIYASKMVERIQLESKRAPGAPRGL
ncbi:MAG: HEAT repeat domain-containing protein [Candidatus Riflebacteria bacterium]|nr:HEAT repeat domain-containing protein [Candidatus Riflebacteria bacterium]